MSPQKQHQNIEKKESKNFSEIPNERIVQKELSKLLRPELEYNKFEIYSKNFSRYFEEIYPHIDPTDHRKFLLYILENTNDIPEIQEKTQNRFWVYTKIMKNSESFLDTPEALQIYQKIIDYDLRLFFMYCPADLLKTEWGMKLIEETLEDFNTKIASIYLQKIHAPEEKADKIIEKIAEKNGHFGALLNQQKMPSISKLKEDPAFPFYEKLFEQKHFFDFPSQYTTARDQVQFLFQLARNLYHQGIPIDVLDTKTVQHEISMFFEYQKKYAEIELFRGRNVLLLANSEQHSAEDAQKYPLIQEDLYRFGRDAVVKSIHEQGGTVERIRPDQNKTSALEKKTEILQKIAEQKEPFTFIFDGHGEGDDETATLKIYTDFETNEKIFISGEELAKSYFESCQKRPNKAPENPDIFIIASCFNHTFSIKEFISAFQERNKKNNTSFQIPIIITGSEYGQLLYSEPRSPHGNFFFEKTLEMNTSTPSKIKDVIENEKKQHGSNPSVFIPSPQNTPLQIATQKKKSSLPEYS